MRFDQMGLSKPLLDSLHKMGFDTPTPIQEQAIPVLMQGKDLFGQAQTGTGKTAAFGLPILEAWLRSAKTRTDENTPSQVYRQNQANAPQHVSGPPVERISRSGAPYISRHPQNQERQPPRAATPYAIVLVPTRELAVQVNLSLQKMAMHTGATVIPIYGGVEMRRQYRMLNSGVDIIVGTPGRTLDHIRQNTLKLDKVHTVVLDEADRMLDMGFIYDVKSILELTPHSRQTLLFSATLPREIVQIAHKYMKNPQTIKVSEDVLTVDLIKQHYVRVDKNNRFGMLLAAMHTLKPFLSLVFVRTKHDAKKLARQLSMSGIKADAMHGNLRQNARERTMGAFRNGKIDVLVATDLASRGIDVTGISHVFNYDMPPDPMTYVHRIGRTGRAGMEGVAISLILGNTRNVVETIQHATGSTISEMPLTAELVSMPEGFSRDGDDERRETHGHGHMGGERFDRPQRHRREGGEGFGRPSHSRHEGDSEWHGGSPHMGGNSHRQGRTKSHGAGGRPGDSRPSYSGSRPSHSGGSSHSSSAHHHSSHRRR